jgi:ankyrin repeat protein
MAIRQDDAAAVAAAIAAGASLRDEDYDGTLGTPLQIAVTLGSRKAIQLLAELVPSLNSGMSLAILFNDRSAFEILAEVEQPKPDFAVAGLRLFASRVRPAAREAMRIELERRLNGMPASDDLNWERLVIPDVAASPSATEFTFAQRLFDLASGTTPEASSDILNDARKSGDVYLADWLLARGVGTADGRFWEDMLVNVVLRGNFLGIQTLISRGVGVNSHDQDGLTPLNAAISIKNIGIVRHLLAEAADPNLPSRRATDQIELPLTQAVRVHSLEIVDALIQSGANVNGFEVPNTWALREAVRNGSPRIVLRLVHAGANVNLQDEFGRTILHGFLVNDRSRFDRRIGEPHLEVLRILGEAGMNFNLKDAKGVSILTSALTEGDPNPTYLTRLTELGARPDNSTYRALLDGRLFSAEWLFSSGYGDPNFHLEGYSLVDSATASGDMPLIRVLMFAGAALPTDPASVANMAKFAIQNDSPEFVLILLLRHMPPDIKIHDDMTALELAVEMGKVAIIRHFLDAGASVNIPGSLGGTILHGIIRSDVEQNGGRISDDHQEAIALLVSLGLNLATKDNFGKTLFEVAETSELTSSKLLASVLQTSVGAAVGLHDAVRANNVSLLRDLIDRGVNMNEPDSLGRTPLSLALSLGRVTAGRLLLRRHAAIGFEAPVPGLFADIYFAGDARFAEDFRLRLLTDPLISQTSDPGGDIERFEAALVMLPPDINWVLGCHNQCGDEVHFAGNSQLEQWGVGSTRIDTKNNTWFNFVVFPDYNLIDFVDPTYTLHGSTTIPGCLFNFDSTPFCIPGIKIELSTESVGALQLIQRNFSKRLGPGEPVYLDRSDGDITIRFDTVEGRRFSVSINIGHSNASPVTLNPSFDTNARVGTYATLARWRRERLAAIAEATTESIARARMLGAVERHLSAQAIGARYPDWLRQLFIQRAADVAGIDQRIADLRRVLQTRLMFTPEDLRLLIQQINELLANVPQASQAQLEAVRDTLVIAEGAATAGDAAIEVAQDGLFGEVDRMVLEYQGLALELAQFNAPESLSAQVPLTPSQRERIRSRISPSDVVVGNDSFDGKGPIVREAFGLPEAMQ